MRRTPFAALAGVVAVVASTMLLAAGASATEPELKPGIPGLKMADVRDHNHLWREIEELQGWEVGNRISIAEYRNKAIEKTGQFLGFEGEAATSFASASMATVLALRDASRASSNPEISAEESDKIYREGLASAESRMNALLTDQPRHQVFKPKVRLWLLRLALGPDNREEDRENKAAANTTDSPSTASPPSKPPL